MNLKLPKIAILLLFLLLFNELSAQNTGFQKKLTIELNNSSIHDLLTQLNDSSNINFSYNNNIIPEGFTITKTYTNETIENILNDVFKETQLSYLIIENQIIIKIDPNKKIEIKKHTLSGYIKDIKNGETLIGATIYINENEAGTITNTYGYYSITVH